MAELTGKIYEANIADQSLEYWKLFSANRNLMRHIPSTIDGLKPVQRRILYDLYSGYDYNNKSKEHLNEHFKVGAIGGTTMARMHPHGNTSIESAAASMANPNANNIPLLDGQGNFGSKDGDEAGAARYIEANISEFAWKCYFEDFDKRLVDMTPTYTGKGEEPEYLPSRYPVILVNGAFASIGSGMASNIPPYNFKEICEATIKLIKNPHAKIYFAPDSPTGCDVINNKECREGFRTGLGKVTFQATFDIDYYTNSVKITSIPPNIKMKDVVVGISKLKLNGKLPNLVNIMNLTNRKGIDCTLQFNKDANVDAIIDQLLKSDVGLRDTKSIGIIMIDDFCDHDYSVPSFILTWLDYRRDQIRSSFNTKLVMRLEEKHINDIKLFVLNKDNIETTVKLAKSSPDKKTYVEKLMKTYKITSLQAEIIAQMRTTDFNKDAYARYKELDLKLKEEIKSLEKAIDDTDSIDNLIIEQLQEGIKLFGTPRKSRVIDPNARPENTECLLGISEDGYVKKILVNNTIGKISKTPGMRNMVSKVMNHDKILVFDSTGRITTISVQDIPMSKATNNGVPLSRFASISGKIVTVLTAPRKADPELDKHLLVMISSKGNVKKISMTSFLKLKTDMLATITDDDNELVTVLGVKEGNYEDIIMYTNFGDGIRIDLSSIKVYGRAAKGASIITLRPNEVITGASVIKEDKEFLFYITSSGKAKLTKSEYFPVMKKKDLPLPLINLNSNEELIGVCAVDPKDTVRIYRKLSDPIEIAMKDVKITTRVAKADKIVKLPKGDSVVGFEKI